MICRKCSATVLDDSLYCSQCGRKMQPEKRSAKARGNGQGTAYKDRKTGKWVAQVVVGYREPKNDSHQPIPIKRTKGGFSRKVDALAYCAKLKEDKPVVCQLTLSELYEEWEPWYTPRIGATTMACYRAAYLHFADLHEKRIVDICAGDLQKSMDACKLGHRTHQNMKVTAGLLWKYATDHNYTPRNIAENLYIGKGQSTKREPLTEEEVEKIRQAIPGEPYAEYIYALCYLGYRPGEMLEIKKEQVSEENGRLYIIEGKKTDAGRDRLVPVHQKIEPIIRKQLQQEGTEYVFPMLIFDRKGAFQGFKKMTDSYFNKSVFKPLMARLGIADGKVPYSARHTFSNKLKKADGDNMDKARLIGHTDYAFTQDKYQTTSKDELRAIMDSID